jgi:monoamine oxidase
MKMFYIKAIWFLVSINFFLVSHISCGSADVSKNDRIVIVGAGAAGISAISRLLESGYNNVILLEAQDYMGGRVQTIPFGDNVVDLGGQWVHGEEDNIIFEMVRKYNILDKTPYSWLGIGGIKNYSRKSAN